MTRLLGVLALAVAAATVGCTHTGDNNDMDQGNAQNQMDNGNNMTASSDQHFVSTAAGAGMYEVAEGQLASSKASSSAVRSIGQRMVADHTKANDQLTTLAKSKGLTVPTAMTEDQNDKVNKLKGMDGADFDREYLQQQTAAHHEAIALFTAESKSGRDADLRSFAKDTLPTLQEHLRMITSQEMGSGGMK